MLLGRIEEKLSLKPVKSQPILYKELVDQKCIVRVKEVTALIGCVTNVTVAVLVALISRSIDAKAVR